MDKLTSMTVFRAVIERGSFAKAARKLRLSNAAVSKHVAALEEHLGVRLLHRTTRRLSLTPEGEVYYRDLVHLLDGLDALEGAMRGATARVAGRLRLDAPMSFGITQLGPLLCAFRREHPDLDLDVSLTDRFVDLLEEGVDVALRIAGALPDSSLVAARIAPVRRVVCASPAYLRAHGTPGTPDDLAAHDCLLYSGTSNPDEWTLSHGAESRRVRVRGHLKVDNSLVLRDAVLASAGIALIPTFAVGADLAAGRLIPLLGPWEPSVYALHAVYPHAHHLPAKVRAFVSFLQKRLGPEPPWDAGWHHAAR